MSGVLKRKIAVVYADASQTDLELVGEVCFPNLHYDMAAVEFGSVLNDTTARQLVVMTNTSKVDAAFHWQFAESETTGDGETRSTLSVVAYTTVLGPGVTTGACTCNCNRASSKLCCSADETFTKA